MTSTREQRAVAALEAAMQIGRRDRERIEVLQHWAKHWKAAAKRWRAGAINVEDRGLYYLMALLEDKLIDLQCERMRIGLQAGNQNDLTRDALLGDEIAEVVRLLLRLKRDKGAP